MPPLMTLADALRSRVERVERRARAPRDPDPKDVEVVRRWEASAAERVSRIGERLRERLGQRQVQPPFGGPVDEGDRARAAVRDRLAPLVRATGQVQGAIGTLERAAEGERRRREEEARTAYGGYPDPATEAYAQRLEMAEYGRGGTPWLDRLASLVGAGGSQIADIGRTPLGQGVAQAGRGVGALAALAGQAPPVQYLGGVVQEAADIRPVIGQDLRRGYELGRTPIPPAVREPLVMAVEHGLRASPATGPLLSAVEGARGVVGALGGPSGGPGAAEVAADIVVPREAWEVVIEAIPEVGFGPEVVRALRKGGPEAARIARVLRESEEGRRLLARLGEEEGAIRFGRGGGGDVLPSPGPLTRGPEEDLPLTGQGVRGGNRFASPLRPFDDVQREVVTSDNPLVQAAVGRTRINPSVMRTDDVGRALTAYQRQQVAAQELTRAAVTRALDAHAQRFSGRSVFNISADGRVTNVAIPEGKSGVWQDVFSRPGDYPLTPRQRAYVDDFLAVIDEVERLRVAEGLKPLARRGADGWFYVPRQVKSVRGVELRRPSSPKLQRIYDEAVEGVASGIKYDTDPRATLELHVGAAYREMAEKQLSDAIETMSITPKELVPEGLRKRMEAATRALRAAHQRAIKARAQHMRNPGHPARRAAETALADARRDFQSVRAAYTRRLDAARRAEVAPGRFWGPNQPNEIAVAQWRNRILPREQADQLTEALGAFRRPGQTANWLGKGFEILGNHVRFLSAVGDFATPFVLGLPIMFRHPQTWAKATLLHYQAFPDPAVQARFMREFGDEIAEMAQHGTPIGDPEFFAAIEAAGPGLGTLVRKTRTGQTAYRQTFGRFQASYNTFLTVARAQLTRGLRAGIPDAAQRQQIIRNMTGGLDSRALGVGPNQRGVEGTWLAFSPRLLRSTLALIPDAARGPGDPVGREALSALGSLMAGAAGVYIATGVALGKSDREIADGLNPLNGKRFMSHEINGDWIGVGGQVRAVVQLIARAATDPASLAAKDEDDNPLLAFLSSRGAPGMSVARAGVELSTGADAEPFVEIDSLPDLLKHVGTSALPFALQGVIEGEQPLTTAAALVGARTSPETPTEAGHRIAGEFDGDYAAAYRDAVRRGDDKRRENVRRAWRQALRPQLEEAGAYVVPGTPNRRARIEFTEWDELEREAVPLLMDRLRAEAPDTVPDGDYDSIAALRAAMIEHNLRAYMQAHGVGQTEARSRLGRNFDRLAPVRNAAKNRDRYRLDFWRQHPDLLDAAAMVDWEQLNDEEREILKKAGLRQ